MLFAITDNIDTNRRRIRQPFIHLFVIRSLNNQYNLSIVDVCIKESLNISYLSISNSLTCISHRRNYHFLTHSVSANINLTYHPNALQQALKNA